MEVIKDPQTLIVQPPNSKKGNFKVGALVFIHIVASCLSSRCSPGSYEAALVVKLFAHLFSAYVEGFS